MKSPGQEWVDADMSSNRSMFFEGVRFLIPLRLDRAQMRSMVASNKSKAAKK